jgi:hypothetical protein
VQNISELSLSYITGRGEKMTEDRKGKWGVQRKIGLPLYGLSLGSLLLPPCTLTGWPTHVYICNGQRAWRYFATSVLLSSTSVFQETGFEISLNCDSEQNKFLTTLNGLNI